jgi:hypothetical protein
LQEEISMRRSLLLSLGLLALPAPALAQMGPQMPSTPMAVDLRKVAVGSWAEYSMTMGPMAMKMRVALVARDAGSNTLESILEGGAVAAMGGKVGMKMVLAADPTNSDRPVKQMVMQIGALDPMEMPLNMPGAGAQKFEKPDPKKLVGTEQVKVGAGTFTAKHYRDQNASATIDMWISTDVPPLGVVKVNSAPKPGAKLPNGQPMPPMAMELTGRGADAKPSMTKPAKPFNPAMLMGGGPPPGAGGGAGPGAVPGAGAGPAGGGAPPPPRGGEAAKAGAAGKPAKPAKEARPK